MINLDVSFIPTASEMIRWCSSKNLNKQFHQVIQAASFIAIWQVWKTRNMLLFQGKRMDYRTTVIRTKSNLVRLSFLFYGTVNRHDIRQLTIIRGLGVAVRLSRGYTLRKVLWVSPPPGWHKVDIDGAARGAPGLASYGFSMLLGSQLEIMGFILAV